MAEILLTTLNARYAHASFGLRYLLANMGELADRTELVEFVANAPISDMVAAIAARNPRIVGIGVYIWNVEPATRLVAELKRALPAVKIVLGGPEVSYEVDEQEIVRLADHVDHGGRRSGVRGSVRRSAQWPHAFLRRLLPRRYRRSTRSDCRITSITTKTSRTA